MSVTSLKRKALRNRIKAKTRKAEIKRLSLKPTLKNIDIKAIWADFEEKGKKTTAKKAEAVEEKISPKEQQTEAAMKEELKKLEPNKTKETAESNADTTSEASSDSKSKKSNPAAKKSKSK